MRARSGDHQGEEKRAPSGRQSRSGCRLYPETWRTFRCREPARYGRSRRSSKAELDPAGKSFEAAQYLLRLFRSLDALLGSDDMAARAWLATPNLDLEARPIDLIDSFKGLMTVCDYVDAHRARV